MGWADDYEKSTGPEKIIKPTPDIFTDIPERLLIYSEAGVGKTYALCSIMDYYIKQNNNVKVFFLSTDNGLAKTFLSYFKDRARHVFTNYLEYYPINDIIELDSILKSISKKAKKSDLLMIDLISDIWEMSQDAIISFNDKKSPKSILDSLNDSDKIGFLTSFQWQIAKKLDNLVSFYLVAKPFCNIFATAVRKDNRIIEMLEEFQIKKGKRDKHSDLVEIYDEIGWRPGGQKTLTYKFDTIIYLEGFTNKYFTVVKDRGTILQAKKIKYLNNFYDEFLKTRNEVV